MTILNVFEQKHSVLPLHADVFARAIYQGKNVTVSHSYMLAHGYAEIHMHEESEHIFYVLKGALKASDGKTTHIVKEGCAVIAPPGEMHEITGTGDCDCEYIVVTCPPAKWK